MEQSRIIKPKPTRQQAVGRLLEQLSTMDRKDLLKLWRDLFDRVPSPALRRETLIPILAYEFRRRLSAGSRSPLPASCAS